MFAASWDSQWPVMQLSLVALRTGCATTGLTCAVLPGCWVRYSRFSALPAGQWGLPCSRCALPCQWSAVTHSLSMSATSEVSPGRYGPRSWAARQSYAFRPGQPGSILDCTSRDRAVWTEPTAAEREVALGYPAGSTAAEGVSESARCRALGTVYGCQCTQGPFGHSVMRGGSGCRVVSQSQQPLQLQPKCSSCRQLTGSWGDSWEPAHLDSGMLLGLCVAAAAQEALTASSSSSSEIWSDHPALMQLQQGQLPEGLSNAERTRIRNRLKQYHWDEQQQQLHRRMTDGSLRIVPRPEQRQHLVQQQHQLSGHFGVRRTAASAA